MKTLKVMGIVGIALFVLSMVCMLTWETSDPSAAIGWGIINAFYSLAMYIVAVVQGTKKIN